VAQTQIKEKPKPLTITDFPPYLIDTLARADEKGILCPPVDLMFSAFRTDPDEVKVVILGQDPYHTPGKANGLAFGYHPDYDGRLDASLFNIIKEIYESTGQKVTDFSLRSWADQGVLLLNTRLTTEVGRPLAHKKLGYEEMIKDYISHLSQYHDNLVFMLWGKEAESYRTAIHAEGGHLTLITSHPSPYSADLGFLGCGHFATANVFLADHGKRPIRWGE